MRRRLLLLLAGAIAVAVIVTTLVSVLHNKRTLPGTPTFNASSIPGSGGTSLAGHVYLPRGSGRHPLLVMPASWGSSAQQYAIVGTEFAERGYIVVAYAQRGFGASAGQVDFAGPDTQADVSAVITWALAHTQADPAQIGAIGVSYGAGISLLAAEHDPRIKAVVAMSTWTDLQQSFFPNGTPNAVAVRSLFSPATQRRLSPPVSSFQRAFFAGDASGAASQLAALSPARSPDTAVAALNRNHTAVMIANDFEDSYFNPSQLVSFFAKLTTPKRLQLAAGDHGSQEVPGLDGTPDAVWIDAADWLDHYLRGISNGIQAQAPVQLEDVRTDVWHGFTSWPTTGDTLFLGPSTASAADAGNTGWSQTIDVGTATTANSAPIQVGVYPYQGVTDVQLSSVSRAAAGVWNGPVTEAPLSINGQVAVRLTVAPSAQRVTLFAHLYDTSATGSSDLITSEPYSLTAAAPRTAQTVDLTLAPISWTVPAGDHLTLVVDTVDPRYTSFGTSGETLTFSSPSADPSRITLPVG